MAGNPVRILIAGGGTGGHLFPAFAVAEALKKLRPETVVHFVGSRFGLETRHFPARKDPYTLLKIRGWVRGFSWSGTTRNLGFPFRFVGAYLTSRRLLSEFQPDVVVGTGGYASGLPLLAAVHKGIPTAIQEQNSYPGSTTRWLAKRVRKVFLSYPETARYLKKKTLWSPATRCGRN
ncbi:MAG: glycosyltransferase [Fidelibacterota bacterium]